jgi:type IV secretory pathway VirB4 component
MVVRPSWFWMRRGVPGRSIVRRSHPLWLKTLRKKNVAVVFATQSLSDIADSQIAPAIIESCPTRRFLPDPRALVNDAAINSVAVTEAVPNHQPSEMW